MVFCYVSTCGDGMFPKVLTCIDDIFSWHQPVLMGCLLLISKCCNGDWWIASRCMLKVKNRVVSLKCHAAYIHLDLTDRSHYASDLSPDLPVNLHTVLLPDQWSLSLKCRLNYFRHTSCTIYKAKPTMYTNYNYVNIASGGFYLFVVRMYTM